MGSSDYKLKLAVIAGASEALKQKAQSSAKTDNEILRVVSSKMEEIIWKIN